MLAARRRSLLRIESTCRARSRATAVGDTNAADVQLHHALGAFERLGATLDVVRVSNCWARRLRSPVSCGPSCSQTSRTRRRCSQRWGTINGPTSCVGMTQSCAACSHASTAKRSNNEAAATGSSSCSCRPRRARLHDRDPTSDVRRQSWPSPASRADRSARGGSNPQCRRLRRSGVHETARIAALAHGGEILTSLRTLESAGSRHQTSPARTTHLKGLPTPIVIASVKTPNSRTTRT